MPFVLPPLSLRDRMLVTALLLLTALIYWPGLTGGYVFDDFNNLVNNPSMSPAAVHTNFWAAVWSSGSGPTDRPISMLTFAIQDLFTGLAPWPLKFVNVLIHLANGLLVFLLMRAVLGFVWAGQARFPQTTEGANGWLIAPNTLALLISAAWLLSPMQLTAVLYVVQRMESLASLFVLAGLLLYWQGRMRLLAGQSGGWWRIWAGLLGGTVLAVFTKESGVMLPVYAFLLEWLILRGRGEQGFEPKFITLYVLILFLPGIAGLLYTLPGALNGSTYAARPFDLAQRLWTEGRVLIDYLHWIIAPTPNALSLYHDDIALSTGWFTPWSTTACWMLIASLVGLALWLKKRAPLFTLGVLWFFAGHLLVSTYLPLELVYEHRNYLPSIGVFIALFGLIFSLQPKDTERRAVIGTLTKSGALALIALYAGFTMLRAHIWGNPYRMAYFESTTHPDSARASYELARVMLIMAAGTDSPLFQMGMNQMENAANIPGASIQADQALVFMAAKNSSPVQTAWWNNLRAKISHQPLSAEDVSALYSLVNCGTNGVCKYTQNDLVELGKTLKLAVARHPKNPDILMLQANYAVNVTHDFSQAYTLMQAATALDPKNFNYWNTLASLQTSSGKFSEARVSIERMGELNGKGIHSASIAAANMTLLKKEAVMAK